MIKIIADNKIPFLEGLFDEIASIEFLPANEINNLKIKNADALIIRTRTKCNESLLKNTNVQFIATATIGFDHIDTEYCKKNNIIWRNSAGCNAESVEQYMYSALLNLAQKHQFTLAGKTLGIIGVGNVGKRVENIAKKLQMNVLLNDPPRQLLENTTDFVDLETIQKKADIITLHTPLIKSGTFKTFHLVDSDFIDKLKPTTFLINTSRGEVIDNNALEIALSRKQIAGAVLDVWENEPEINENLLKLVSFATPHIAGYSADGKANCTWNSFVAICDFFKLKVEQNKQILIPLPEKTNFEIDCSHKNIEQIKTKIINISYNIQNDDKNLRQNSKNFENLRNNYPLRRKLSIFDYKLTNFEDLNKFNIEF